MLQSEVHLKLLLWDNIE